MSQNEHWHFQINDLPCVRELHNNGSTGHMDEEPGYEEQIFQVKRIVNTNA